MEIWLFKKLNGELYKHIFDELIIDIIITRMNQALNQALHLNIIKSNLSVFLTLIAGQKMLIDDTYKVSLDDRYFQFFRRPADHWMSGKPSSRQTTYDVITLTYESLKQYRDYYIENNVLVLQSLNNLSEKLNITYKNFPTLMELIAKYKKFFTIHNGHEEPSCAIIRKHDNEKSISAKSDKDIKVDIHEKTPEKEPKNTASPIKPIEALEPIEPVASIAPVEHLEYPDNMSQVDPQEKPQITKDISALLGTVSQSSDCPTKSDFEEKTVIEQKHENVKEKEKENVIEKDKDPAPKTNITINTQLPPLKSQLSQHLIQIAPEIPPALGRKNSGKKRTSSAPAPAPLCECSCMCCDGIKEQFIKLFLCCSSTEKSDDSKK